MTNQHLSREQLERYRDRALSPGELSAVDAHLGRCADCRDVLAASARTASAATLLAAIQESSSEHITFEQMDAWVDDTIDPTERELVSAHIGHCGACARQLRKYEQAAPAMSVPVVRMQAQPAQLAAAPLSFRERMFAFMRSPQAVIATAALVVAAIVAPYLAMRNSRSGGEAAITLPNNGTPDPLDLTPLDSIPDSLKEGARAMLTASEPAVPDALDGLKPPAGEDVQYPVSETVVETQPTLQWSPFAAAYSVSVSDLSGAIIARAEGIAAAEWRVPRVLTRGGIYAWTVTAEGRTETASFRVLDNAEMNQLTSVRLFRSGSPLVMGVVAQQLGLMTLAEGHFENLAQQNPNSPLAARLLQNARALRGK
jgi:anti-sigma factor RsiW